MSPEQEVPTVKSIFVQLSNELEVQAPTPMKTLLPLIVMQAIHLVRVFLGLVASTFVF